MLLFSEKFNGAGKRSRVKIKLVPERKLGFFVKIKEDENFNHPVEEPGQAGIFIIFRGLFFERNAEIE